MKKLLLTSFISSFIFAMFAQTQVGRTTYDLQTNSSVCRRIAENAAGELSITYTKSHAMATAFNDRGTGYNYSADNGTTWTTSNFSGPLGTFTRPDTGRTGWPNVVYSGTKEFVASHTTNGAPGVTNDNNIQVMRRDLGTTNPWDITLLTNVVDATWARLASNGGDSLVLIHGLFTPSALPGMTGGMIMQRSADGGDTWIGPDTISFVTDQYFKTIGGDNYSIDMNENGKIAISLGSFQIEVLISNDFGDTWTKTTAIEVVDINGTPNNVFDGEIGETMQLTEMGDGSYSVIVDDNDLVHLFFGRITGQKLESTTAGFTFFPISAGIMYWNENMASGRVLHESRLAAQQAALPNPLFTGQVTSFAQNDLYRGSSLIGHPSAGYDTNGNIYVAYDGMVPAIFDDTNDLTSTNNVDAAGFHLRDIFVMKSADNGVTWEGPINVTNTPLAEDVYAGIPRKMYGTNLGVLWQQDSLVSNSLNTASGVAATITEQKIMFLNVDFSTITTPTDITAPTIFEIETGINNIDAFLGCQVDYADVFENDDVPQGPNVLPYQVVDASALATPGTHVIEVFVVDAAGNSSDTIQAVVTVNAAPAATLIGPDTLSLLLNTSYTDPGLDFSNVSCIPALPPTVVSTIDSSVAGWYTYTYSYEDYLGSTVNFTRDVEVVSADNIAPIISFIGMQTETIEACQPWTDLGVTAFDNIDYDLTTSIVTTGDVVDPNVIGTYVTTYEVTDAAMNTATEVRTVIVEDNTDPVITVSLIGSVQYATVNDPAYAVPTAVAADCDLANTTLTDDHATSVDISTTGVYTLTYTAIDGSSNQATKTIQVVVNPETGIVENKKLDAAINIFPNPSNGIITLNIQDNKLNDVDVKIYNVIGELITSEENVNPSKNNELTFDLGDTKGIYFVNISTKDATVSKRVIIK